MKSKPIIYLLGFLVLCIWGLIVYRVFASVHDGSNDQTIQAARGKAKKISLPKLYPDTFKLVLNYPDPFTGATASMPDSAVLKKVKRTIAAVAPVIQVINPVTEMKYLGFVSDGKGKRQVAIMSYQGTEKILKEKDTLEGVKIIDIKRGGIMVMYHGKTTLIKAE